MGYHALFYSLQRLNSDDEVYEDVRNMVSLLLPSIKRTYLLASNELSPLWFGIFAGTANQYYDGDVTDDEVDRVNYSLQHQAIDMIDWVISNYQRMDISMQPFVVRGGNTPLMKEIRPMSERNKVYSYMHYIFTKLVMLYLLLLLLLLVRFHSTFMLSKLVTLYTSYCIPYSNGLITRSGYNLSTIWTK